MNKRTLELLDCAYSNLLTARNIEQEEETKRKIFGILDEMIKLIERAQKENKESCKSLQ